MRLLSLPAPPLARTKPGTPHRPAGAGGHSRQPTAPGGHRAALPLPAPRTEASPLPHSAGSSGAPDSPAALTARAGPGPPGAPRGRRRPSGGGGRRPAERTGRGGRRGALSPAVTEDARSRGAGRTGSPAHPPAAPSGPETTPARLPARPAWRPRAPAQRGPARPAPRTCPMPRWVAAVATPAPALGPAHPAAAAIAMAGTHFARHHAGGRVTKREAAAARGAAPEQGGVGGGEAAQASRSASRETQFARRSRVCACVPTEPAPKSSLGVVVLGRPRCRRGPSVRPGARASLSAVWNHGPPRRGCRH